VAIVAMLALGGAYLATRSMSTTAPAAGTIGAGQAAMDQMRHEAQHQMALRFQSARKAHQVPSYFQQMQAPVLRSWPLSAGVVEATGSAALNDERHSFGAGSIPSYFEQMEAPVLRSWPLSAGVVQATGSAALNDERH
jgi:hypothetical protein